MDSSRHTRCAVTFYRQKLRHTECAYYFRRLVPSAATAAMAATMTAAATTATATAAFGFGPGFIDGQRPAATVLAVQGGNRSLGLLIGFHLDEAETFGTAGVAIDDDLSRFHRAVGFEHFAEVCVRHPVTQVSDIKLLAHYQTPLGVHESNGSAHREGACNKEESSLPRIIRVLTVNRLPRSAPAQT